MKNKRTGPGNPSKFALFDQGWLRRVPRDHVSNIKYKPEPATPVEVPAHPALFALALSSPMLAVTAIIMLLKTLGVK